LLPCVTLLSEGRNFGTAKPAISHAAMTTQRNLTANAPIPPEYGVDAQAASLQISRVLEARRTWAAGGDLVVWWDADGLLKPPSVSVQVTRR
jgi:hypothetical protein